jgi:hypothetical protein
MNQGDSMRRTDAIALSLAYAIGLAVGFVLALPLDSASCPAPGAPGFSACQQVLWGRFVLIVVGTASVSGVLAYVLMRWGAPAARTGLRAMTRFSHVGLHGHRELTSERGW